MSSKETKSSICLSAHVADMCIPSKACVIVTPRYLMESTFSRSGKCKKPQSYLFFSWLSALYCIWLAEISYPIFWPNILIYLYPSKVSMSPLSLWFHDSKYNHLRKVLFLCLCLWKYHLCTERTIMDQERSLVGHLTILEPTPVSPFTTARCVLYQGKESISLSVFLPMP